MTSEQQREFNYPFQINVDTFKAKTKIGLTQDEALTILGAFAAPFLVLQSITGMVLGVAAAIVAFLAIRKYDRFGGASLPVYISQRLRAMVQSNEVELIQIVPRVKADVTRVTYDGETIAKFDQP